MECHPDRENLVSRFFFASHNILYISAPFEDFRGMMWEKETEELSDSITQAPAARYGDTKFIKYFIGLVFVDTY